MTAILAMTMTLWLPMVAYTPPTTSEKKGVAVVYSGEHWRDALSVGARWAYGWSPFVLDTGGLEWIPMYWDETQIEWEIRGGSFEWIMGFNEPELAEQADMTPTLAAELWKTIEQRYPDKRLVSPAVVIDAEWLVDFRNAYQRRFAAYPKLDALAAHCYRPTSTDCEAWVGQFIRLAAEWGVPEVWVTEFTFADIGELEKFVAWMESQTTITRYAYFTNRQYQNWGGYLFREDGIPTEYGKSYRVLH